MIRVPVAGLRELDAAIRECEEGITSLFEDVYQQDFGIKSLSLERHTSYGYCLRCPLREHNTVKRLHKAKVVAFFATLAV